MKGRQGFVGRKWRQVWRVTRTGAGYQYRTGAGSNTAGADLVGSGFSPQGNDPAGSGNMACGRSERTATYSMQRDGACSAAAATNAACSSCQATTPKAEPRQQDPMRFKSKTLKVRSCRPTAYFARYRDTTRWADHPTHKHAQKLHYSAS